MTKAKEDFVMDENRNSLFSEDERDEHNEKEFGLVARAKQGDFSDLFTFWKVKRVVFTQRVFERIQ